MMFKPNRFIIQAGFFLFVLTALLPGCKKDSGTDDSNEYYFTANVEGKAWAANVPASGNYKVVAGPYNNLIDIVVDRGC